MLKRRFQALGGVYTLYMGAIFAYAGSAFSYLAPAWQLRISLSPK